MITHNNVRFFTVAYLPDVDREESEFCSDWIDTIEISEGCFKELIDNAGGTAPISYDRHTLRESGCCQICLTLDLDEWPQKDDLQSPLT